MSRRVFSGGRVTCAASRVSVLDFISVPKATITQRPRLFQGGSGSSAQGTRGQSLVRTAVNFRNRHGGCPLVPLWGSARRPPAIFFKLFQVERFVLRVG